MIPCKSLSRLLAVCVHSSSTLLVWEGRGEERGGAHGHLLCKYISQVTAIRIRFLAPRRTGVRTTLLRVSARAEGEGAVQRRDAAKKYYDATRNKAAKLRATMEGAMLGRFGICCTLLAVALQGKN